MVIKMLIFFVIMDRIPINSRISHNPNSNPHYVLLVNSDMITY